jgi:hypothetical protein
LSGVKGDGEGTFGAVVWSIEFPIKNGIVCVALVDAIKGGVKRAVKILGNTRTTGGAAS